VAIFKRSPVNSHYLELRHCIGRETATYVIRAGVYITATAEGTSPKQVVGFMNLHNKGIGTAPAGPVLA